MPKYIYIGVTTSGKQIKGEIEASNKTEAASILRKRRIRPISIKTRALQFQLSIGSAVNITELSRFTRQFSAMQSAGLPLVQCLDILSSQTENKVFSKTIQQISAEIQGGSTLAVALSKHPKIFNALFCNMIAAGEAAGNLDVILNRLAVYLEKSDALRRKIKSAMTYPAVVSLVAIAATIAMLYFIVPTFAKMFTDLGGQLPLPTRIVLAISDLIQKYILFFLGFCCAIVLVIKSYYNTENGKYNIDNIKLKIPIFGDLERKSSISRFSQTLATLLSSGVTIIDALSITSKTAGNKVLERGILRTLEKITGGLTIAEPLKQTGVFPPMVIHMIAVGEKTGDLADMLTKVADFYQQEVDAAVDALTSILEPVLIIIMGIIIGGVLISMYLPMFDMIGVIQ